ncbi:WD40 repeat domain-containing protein [Nitrosomonas ureae]|uniref:WD40 repeat domain-containing protein n=1 Tax=Nitrosomonas ureae TaxID=44577 RepID=UPI0035BE78BC
MATGSKDKTIILWQADTLESKQKIKGRDLGILDLAFTPDGKRLVSGSKDKTVRVWDVATGNRQAVLAAHSDVVNAVAIHGDYLATAGEDGIRLWDLRSLEPVPVFPSRRAFSMAIAGIILLQNVSLVV